MKQRSQPSQPHPALDSAGAGRTQTHDAEQSNKQHESNGLRHHLSCAHALAGVRLSSAGAVQVEDVGDDNGCAGDGGGEEGNRGYHLSWEHGQQHGYGYYCCRNVLEEGEDKQQSR